MNVILVDQFCTSYTKTWEWLGSPNCTFMGIRGNTAKHESCNINMNHRGSGGNHMMRYMPGGYQDASIAQLVERDFSKVKVQSRLSVEALATH